MKKNVTLITLVILALFSIYPEFISAQTSFDPENYKQFLIDNKNLGSEEFLQRHDRGGRYYSNVIGAGSLSGYMYLDSIAEKYAAGGIKELKRSAFDEKSGSYVKKLESELVDAYQSLNIN